MDVDTRRAPLAAALKWGLLLRLEERRGAGVAARRLARLAALADQERDHRHEIRELERDRRVLRRHAQRGDPDGDAGHGEERTDQKPEREERARARGRVRARAPRQREAHAPVNEFVDREEEERQERREEVDPSRGTVRHPPHDEHGGDREHAGPDADPIPPAKRLRARHAHVAPERGDSRHDRVPDERRDQRETQREPRVLRLVFT